jgi:hypothetical protein
MTRSVPNFIRRFTAARISIASPGILLEFADSNAWRGP